MTTKAMIAFVVMVWGRSGSSPPGTTGTSPTGPTRRTGPSSSSSPSAAPRCAQKGPLWWAGNHREHHRYSDTELDIHSPLRGLLVEPRRLDPLRQVRRDPDRPHPRLRQVPRAAVRRQVERPVPVDGRHRLLPLRRLVGPVLRVLPGHGRAVAQHVPGELARPRHGAPSLRHRRHQPELAADRHHDPRRGLAQQPPLLPGVGSQRLLLVGDRRHLLRAQGPQLGRPRA